MHPEIARAWSVLLIRGVCNVLFAFIAFLQPGLTLVALVLLWGVYAVVDGALLLTTGIAARRTGRRHWALILSGASGLVFGVAACVWPGVTLLVLLTMMSAWAILRGAMEIAAAARLRHVVPRSWLFAVSGSISVVFGALLYARPSLALMALVYLVGAAALAFGIVAILMALHLRHLSLDRGGDADSGLRS